MKLIFFIALLVCSFTFSQKMNGVNLVSAKRTHASGFCNSIDRIAANYIALTPFMIMEENNPHIDYECKDNWWGDYRKNMVNIISEAHFTGKKVMLKPHIWVKNVGWAGKISYNSKGWKKWHHNFRKRMLEFARFAEKHNVESLCIGVELKSAVERNPSFFIDLIDEIRKLYTGKLTYASNWDNYFNVPFWNKLDFIGIDGYFPISTAKNPTKEQLVNGWKKRIVKMENFSKKVDRKIIFTEFGYRSTDYALGKQWEIEKQKDLPINFSIQNLGYEVFFQEVYQKDFVAGGFIWKWFTEDHKMKNMHRDDYSPQHKPVEKVIKAWYSKN